MFVDGVIGVFVTACAQRLVHALAGLIAASVAGIPVINKLTLGELPFTFNAGKAVQISPSR